ncbi:MAG: arsenate reductase (glutaredoxin) [Bacteroidia bacterium]|nr:arsenate reductase (glutaredoxin) [Bacteroidia bacterium]
MNQPIIYHNSACSKCMLVTHILEENGFKPIAVNYLLTPLNRSQLKELLILLNLNAKDMVRKDDPIFIENYSKIVEQDEYLDALEKFPILMQRPVVVYKGKAIIARPPQKVLDILK